MGIQPHAEGFHITPNADTLTFVDMRPTHTMTHNIQTSNILNHCRKAHSFARSCRIHIAFVYGPGLTDRLPETEKWIDGFEPKSTDQIFHRRQLSCFSSPYFGESLCSRGRIVLAGFLGDGGGMASCIDAYMERAEITLLSDALYDPLSKDIISDKAIEMFCRHMQTGISVLSTDEWIASNIRQAAE